VDLKCRIQAKCALFRQLMRESRRRGIASLFRRIRNVRDAWRSEVNSNYRYRFVNSQTIARVKLSGIETNCKTPAWRSLVLPLRGICGLVPAMRLSRRAVGDSRGAH
jgi:hypothetical protein